MIPVNRWASCSQKSDDLMLWKDLYLLLLHLCVYMFRAFFFLIHKVAEIAVFKSMNYKCLQFTGGDGKTDYVESGQCKRQLPKIQCSCWPSPVLIFHLIHTTPTPASAPHTVPAFTAHLSNLPQAPSVTCQPLGTGWAPCKNPQGQWLHYPALHPSSKSTCDVIFGQRRILARQLVC